MAVDWSFAGQVGGAGFGTVFALLVILAIVIWLTGLLVNKIGSTRSADNDKQKGD